MRRTILVLASLVFGGLMTWLAFRGTHWAAVFEAMSNADPVWLIATVGLLVVATVLRAARWNIFVKATVITTSFRHVFAAVTIDQLAQMALPLKAGLFIRSIAFSRITGKPLALVYGTATFDRVPELLTLGVFMVVAIAGLPDRDTFVIGADVFNTDAPVHFSGDMLTGLVGVLAVALTFRMGLLIGLFGWRDRVIDTLAGLVGRLSTQAAERVRTLLGHFADALRFLTSWRDIGRAITWTMAFWLLYLAAHASTLMAFGMLDSWQAPMLMLVLTAVSMALPGAPGFIGQWHVAMVLALVIAQPDASTDDMKAVAIVSHMLQVALVSVMGVASLLLEHVSISDLRGEGPPVLAPAPETEA